MTYQQTSASTFDLIVDMESPKSTFCSEYMMFGNTEIRDLEVFFRKGKHTLSYKYDPAQVDINNYGIQSFLFCEGVTDTVEAVLKTLEAFIGGLSSHPNIPVAGSHVPEYME